MLQTKLTEDLSSARESETLLCAATGKTSNFVRIHCYTLCPRFKSFKSSYVSHTEMKTPYEFLVAAMHATCPGHSIPHAVFATHVLKRTKFPPLDHNILPNTLTNNTSSLERDNEESDYVSSLRTFATMRKTISVCLSAWNNSAPTNRILIKLCI
jgi:hypothetical protein